MTRKAHTLLAVTTLAVLGLVPASPALADAPTSTTLTTSPTGIVAAGRSVTLRAEVLGTGTGTVTFHEGDTTLGSVSLVAGVASLTLPAGGVRALPVGAHVLTADYEGSSRSTSSSTALDVSFRDYPPTAAFYGDVSWLVSQGIAGGYADGGFHPGSAVSRQAMAALLYRYRNGAAAPTTCSSAPFPDVPATSPFCAAVTWLVSKNITTGYADGRFRPGAAVSRQATAAFLHRLQVPSSTRGTCAAAAFKDVPAKSVFCRDVSWLAAHKITTGFPDGRFQPAEPVERQAMAAFVHRLSRLGRSSTPPAGVSSLTASRAVGGVQLSWKRPTPAAYAGVTIRRRSGTKAPSSATDGTLVVDAVAPVTSFLDVVPAGTYTYAVFAHDSELIPSRAATARVTVGPTVSAAQRIPLPKDATARQVARSVTSTDFVSCPTARWCGIAGYYQSGKGAVDTVLLGTGYGAKTTTVHAPNAPGGEEQQVNGISCPASGSCFAVGTDLNGGSARALVERFRGGTWTAQVAPLDPGFSAGRLTAVSCASPTFCLATGFEGHGSYPIDQTLVEQWDGSRWTPMTVPQLGTDVLNDPICPAAGFCVASGTSRLWVLRDGTWTATRLPDGFFVGTVACAPDATCTMVSNTIDRSNTTVSTATMFYRDGEWTFRLVKHPSQAPSSGTSHDLQTGGLSCYSGGRCVAVAAFESVTPGTIDNPEDAVYYPGPAVIINIADGNVGFGTPSLRGSGVSPGSVSCSTSGICGGHASDNSGRDRVFFLQNGRLRTAAATWSATDHVFCDATSSCVFVGQRSDSNGVPSPVVITASP
ncbi:S-layer homology domain-containing protein [uncultured Jatrophihabitans sp.]|uniref:S-layer homology domain-containing protein n=1 Tax=uncultured Jatrophihabitans sp. TaxID=1610747 RepID=UPI0035CACAE5